MDKLSYEDLMALTDPLYEEALADFADISKRCRPVDELHTRPPLASLVADPALRAAWFGSGDTYALRARQEALAPFLAEDAARRARLQADLKAVWDASGWTEREVSKEIDRRCDLALNVELS